MFLDIEEKPEIVIEKILIDIFNKYITPGNFDVDFLKIQMHQNKIKLLCTKQEKSKIIYILLYKIRSLINKYREKLFELPNIIKLREKIYQKYYKRSQSEKKITSKNYFNYYLERVDLNTSYPRLKKFNYYHVTKNLFCELKNIKYCLRSELRKEQRDIIKEYHLVQNDKLRTVNLPDKLNDKQEHQHKGVVDLDLHLKAFLG